MASLAGGAEGLQEAAQEALDQEQYAWAAELATHLLRLSPNSSQAKQIRAGALRALGQRHISANGRNYYLTQALEAEGTVKIHDDTHPKNALSFVNTIPIGQFVAAMPANLDADKSADKEMVVGFRFPDVNEAYGIEVRRGVAEFVDRVPKRARRDDHRRHLRLARARIGGAKSGQSVRFGGREVRWQRVSTSSPSYDCSSLRLTEERQTASPHRPADLGCEVAHN